MGGCIYICINESGYIYFFTLLDVQTTGVEFAVSPTHEGWERPSLRSEKSKSLLVERQK